MQDVDESGRTIDSDAIDRQIDYYEARAGEYDDWFYRRGRYERGEELDRAWRREVGVVETALAHCLGEPPPPPPSGVGAGHATPASVRAKRRLGHVLELASGTGLWTRHLVRFAAEVTAVDASSEMLAVHRAKLGDAPVHRVQADLFTWQPEQIFDAVFFGFWLSHVPPEHFEAFWERVRSALVPGGRVFFVDSLYNQESTARDHRLGGRDDLTVERRLDDGRTYRIVKVFYEPEPLSARLAALGWSCAVTRTERFFIYGCGGVAR